MIARINTAAINLGFLPLVSVLHKIPSPLTAPYDWLTHGMGAVHSLYSCSWTVAPHYIDVAQERI